MCQVVGRLLLHTWKVQSYPFKLAYTIAGYTLFFHGRQFAVSQVAELLQAWVWMGVGRNMMRTVTTRRAPWAFVLALWLSFQPSASLTMACTYMELSRFLAKQPACHRNIFCCKGKAWNQSRSFNTFLHRNLKKEKRRRKELELHATRERDERESKRGGVKTVVEG